MPVPSTRDEGEGTTGDEMLAIKAYGSLSSPKVGVAATTACVQEEASEDETLGQGGCEDVNVTGEGILSMKLNIESWAAEAAGGTAGGFDEGGGIPPECIRARADFGGISEQNIHGCAGMGILEMMVGTIHYI